MPLPPHSISRKITLMMVLITGTVLLLACVALFFLQTYSVRQNLDNQLTTTTRMVAGLVRLATKYEDGDRANQILEGLEVLPHIVRAEVTRLDGSQLAVYERQGTVPGNPVVSSVPVVEEGEVCGNLRLLADFAAPRRKLMVLAAGTLCAVLLVSLAVTFWLSRRFQRLVTDPILLLASTARSIAGGKDYSVRAVAGGDNETGILTTAFNRMLDQIETQDQALQDAQQELEQRLVELEKEMAHREAAQVFQGQLIAMLDNTPDFVARTDAKRRFLYLNRAGRRMVGLAQEAPLEGLTFAHVHPDESNQRVEEEAIPAAAASGSWQGETSLRHRDGREIPVSQVLICHRDSTGRVESFSTIMRDITDRRTAEMALRESQDRLLESSRLAGMAEVATSVLHNVGNVLNSVNVSGNLIHDRLRASKLGALTKIAALVGEHRQDFARFIESDSRGRRLPELVLAVTEALQAEHSGLMAELGAISGNIGHIKEIVAMQQSYSRFGGVMEQINPADLVEDAIQLYADSFARHGILVIQECGATAPLLLDKHKVLQILVNLIANARHALEEVKGRERQIRLQIRQDSRTRMVDISVEDNGSGICPDNLTRIFSHGFTTKPQGHGYGLHSSALAAREMGGSLRVHSDGPDKGATFILSLPVCLPRRQGAAEAASPGASNAPAVCPSSPDHLIS